MGEDNKHLRITLTPDQRAQVEKATGKSAEAIELSAEELEQRIAPGKLFPGN